MFKKVFGLLIILLLPFSIKAAGESYTITDYHIKIDVDYNNRLAIKENITAFFNVQERGIEKLIPLVNELKIGSNTLRNNAVVSNIDVNNKFTTYENTINGMKYKVIKIGETNQAVIGEQTYEINYQYSLGTDRTVGSDEFYFKIVGKEWNTNIENVVFEIKMPDIVNVNNVSITNETNNAAGVIYQVIDNKIIGSYNQKLMAGQELIVHVQLPDDYFITDEEANKENAQIKQILNIIDLSLVTLGLVISLVLIYYYNHGVKRNKLSPYPPKQCNSTEVGFFLKRKLDNFMITTYIVSLANKGYIKLKTNKENGLSVIKIKEYDGNNPLEKVFIDEFFMHKVEIDNKQLNDKMLSMSQPLISNFLRLSSNPNFFLNSKQRRYVMQGIIMVILLVCNILTFMPNMDILPVLLGIIVKLLLEVLMISLITKASNLIRFILILPFIGLLGYFDYFFVNMMIGSSNILIYLYCLVITLIIGYLSTKVSLRTTQGNQIVNETKAFKKFIKSVKVEELKQVFVSNPNYFYDVLPYMLTLRIHPKLINKFNDMPFYLPNWYEGNSYSNYKEVYLYLYQSLEDLTKNSFSPLKEIQDEENTNDLERDLK